MPTVLMINSAWSLVRIVTSRSRIISACQEEEVEEPANKRKADAATLCGTRPPPNGDKSILVSRRKVIKVTPIQRGRPLVAVGVFGSTDSDVADDPDSAANTAVPAEFAGVLAVERYWQRRTQYVIVN
jgi:hypothetical protein